MSKDNVVLFHGNTTLDIPPERILIAAGEAELSDVVVIGTDKNGEIYLSSSTADGAMVLWQIEKAKAALMEM